MMIGETFGTDSVFFSNRDAFKHNTIRKKGIRENYRWKEDELKFYFCPTMKLNL